MKIKSPHQMLFVFVLVLFCSGSLWAHCQVPCGIYDDHMRIHMIEEHIDTIEKAQSQIQASSRKKHLDQHQMIRWIQTKEDHSSQIQEIVSQYFLTQRIKRDMKGYAELLELSHQLLVAAMKAKQTIDSQAVQDLRKALGRFETLYEQAKKK
ncbi:MAG: hypothetical protein KDD52_04185 [Bdellovibrionales bacterium]|nr:hypothetical protein [Bdellovibrionales bacterium]